LLEVKREAHAKVNLFLRVLGRREDGYHDLESLIVPLSIHDTVVCREAGGLSLSVEGGDPSLPSDTGNLALVAALALSERAGVLRGADIDLVKRIPVAAGLGGGSADAAAVLLALNELWGCGLSEEALMEVGADVGSDVPAILANRPVLVSGRGERLRAVGVPGLHWVIVPSALQVRTPDAFSWWDEDGCSSGPDPGWFVEALASGDLTSVRDGLSNDLEMPVFARHPELDEIKRLLLDRGALAAIMCGSGPTMAGLYADPDAAARASRDIEGGIVATSRGTA
jgi:4-diphosphocytidyl-2-C-methyl-D-erythritol kinase